MQATITPNAVPCAWVTPQKVPSASAFFTENHPWLGRLFSVIHLARQAWHWQRTSKEVYHYFQNPALAVGDLVGASLAKDSPLLQTATLVAEVIGSGFQAEKARSAMVSTWKELIEQLRNPKEIPYSYPNVHRRDFLYYAKPKIFEILRLIGRLLVQTYVFSMHLMDVTDLLHDPSARKRAHRRLASNLHTIFQHSQLKLNELAISHNLRPMPLFTYFGILPKHIQAIGDHIQTLINPSLNPFAFGWKTANL